ncbi:MAG: hypothetical protein AAGG01_02910 [Planctomycetota bacterium]
MNSLSPTIPALSLLLVSTAAAQGVNDPSVVLINEIRIDQPGNDVDEYFELLTFPGNATLDGFTYLVIGDGASGGIIENVTPLDTFVSNPTGLFTVAEGSFTLGVADGTASLNFENSDNVTHLVVRGFTGADGDDLDTNDDGVLDVTPWMEVMDAISLVEDPMGGDPFYGTALGGVDVGPDGTFVPGHVFRCLTSLADVRFGVFTTGVSDTPTGFNLRCIAETDMFCDPALPNETGAPGEIGLVGDGSIQRNITSLSASMLPDTFGVFGQADMTMPAMMSPIGGNTCLAGTVVRMNRIVPIVMGSAVLDLDFTDGANVESMLEPGETMHYQFFYRDSSFAGGGNFTNGVSVTWVP